MPTVQKGHLPPTTERVEVEVEPQADTVDGWSRGDVDSLQRHCRRCRAPMTWVELPDHGTLWQCDVCMIGLEDVSGNLHRWQRPMSYGDRSDRNEQRVVSNKKCPECSQRMREVMMEGFGSRWQCETCRLTVYSSGGIQHWGPAGPPSAPGG